MLKKTKKGTTMVLDFTEIFVYVDDFCAGFLPYWEKHLISNGLRKRNRLSKLTLSEILTIIIMYHRSPFDCFKYYYQYIYFNHRHDFRIMPCYERFVALMKQALPVLCYLFGCIKGEITGIQFIDSTTLEVCKTPRAKRHKVFAGLAKKGKTSMGWFYGLKLHTVVNHRGEIVALTITSGDADDRKPVPNLVKNIFGKLIGDKGYLSAKLTAELADKGINLITRVRKNMKNILMTMEDKMLLYKRCIIESIYSKLKLFDKLWHSRHRSVENGFTHMIASLIAYQLDPNKPSLKNFIHSTCNP